MTPFAIISVYVLLIVPKVDGQFGTLSGRSSIFSAFGLTDIEVYGEKGEDLADMMTEYQAETSVEDESFGLQRFGTERARLPPGIRVMDFVKDGVFEKEAFRRALRAALAKQRAENDGASSEYVVSTTPITSTTSGVTTTSTTTTGTRATTEPTRLTRVTRRTIRQTTRPIQFVKDPRARPTQSKPIARLAQGPLDEFNYCRQCNGQTEAECVASDNLETCNKAATKCVVTIRQQQWRGQLRYWSGCAQENSCKVQEKQNFHSMMRYSKCLPPNKIGRRWFRSIECNFCHKMGKAGRTHLLFQSDDVGTNDPSQILTYDGASYSSQSISDMLDNPSGFFQPDNISTLQQWY